MKRGRSDCTSDGKTDIFFCFFSHLSFLRRSQRGRRLSVGEQKRPRGIPKREEEEKKEVREELTARELCES